MNDLLIFNLNTLSFEDKIEPQEEPRERCAHTACLYHENKIIIFGGKDDDEITNEVMVITLTKSEEDQGKNLIK